MSTQRRFALASSVVLVACRITTAQNQQWIRQFGTSGYEHAGALALDGTGGVFLGGDTEGDLGGTNLGSFDAWLARYDAGGTQMWIRQLGTSAYEITAAATPDSTGGVLVCGWT